MDSVTTPIYIIIGSILGIISAFVLTILHLPQFVSVIRSFLKWLHSWLRERSRRFNTWRWWRQYRPSWEIANYGELKITKVGDKYDLSVQVEIEYKNRNDKYKVNFYGGYIYAYLCHEGKGWEGQPYYLSKSSDMARTVNPSISEHVVYSFHNDMSIKPLIKETAICKIMGYIWGRIEEDTPYEGLEGLGGKCKRKGSNKFKVGVVWNNEVDTNEKAPSN